MPLSSTLDELAKAASYQSFTHGVEAYAVGLAAKEYLNLYQKPSDEVKHAGLYRALNNIASSKTLDNEISDSITYTLEKTLGNDIAAFLKEEPLPSQDIKLNLAKILLRMTAILSFSLIIPEQREDNYTALENGLNYQPVKEILLNVKKLLKDIKDLEKNGNPENEKKLALCAKVRTQIDHLWNEELRHRGLSTYMHFDYASKQSTSNAKEEDYNKTLSNIEFLKPKSAGTSVGFIGRKTPKDNSDAEVKKSKAEWLFKKQNLRENISEKIGADLIRFFGIHAPKYVIRLSNDKQLAYSASSIMEDFKSVFDESKLPKNKDIINKNLNKLYQDLFNAPGIYRTLAVCTLIRNFDINPLNIGKTNERPAIVDLAKSLHFTLGYDDYTVQLIRDLNSHGTSSDAPFTPAGMIRSLHSTHYRMEASHFLNNDYASALEWVVAYIDQNSSKFEKAIAQSAHEVQAAVNTYQGEKKENLFYHISPTTTVENLPQNLNKALKSSQEEIERFATNIRVQVAIRDNDIDGFARLLKKHPDLLERNIEWLPEKNKPVIGTACSIKRYVKKYHSEFNLQEAVARSTSISVEEQEPWGHQKFRHAKNVFQANKHRTDPSRIISSFDMKAEFKEGENVLVEFQDVKKRFDALTSKATQASSTSVAYSKFRNEVGEDKWSKSKFEDDKKIFGHVNAASQQPAARKTEGFSKQVSLERTEVALAGNNKGMEI